MTRIAPLPALAAAVWLGCYADARALVGGSLDVVVAGVRNDRGEVRVALCETPQFPRGPCRYTARAPARTGTVTVHFTGIAPGTYAAAAFHDEAGTGVLEYSFFGAPRQGFGFSRDAPMHYGPPRFADAAVAVTTAGGIVGLTLRYP